MDKTEIEWYPQFFFTTLWSLFRLHVWQPFVLSIRVGELKVAAPAPCWSFENTALKSLITGQIKLGSEGYEKLNVRRIF